jgi:regulation of enolase protein 1 (concanavalin A-like superfamily)
MNKQVRFEDTFTDKLQDGWHWVREAPEAWRITEDALHIRALPGTLWGERNDARNLLLRPAERVADGFANEVTVRNAPQNRGEQGGVIWYVNDGTYIKLIKESLEDTVWIVLAREVNDQAALVNKIPYRADRAHLELSFEGGRAIGRVRDPEGGDWQVVGECEALPEAEVHPGIFTHGGPEDEERWAEFTDFAVTSAKED